MQFDLKDLITWAGLLIGVVGQFFHLKGWITILEVRQNDLRTSLKDALDKIDHKLDSIEEKLDHKADKDHSK